jgi:hypothetical protein
MAGLKTLSKFGVPIYSTGGSPGKIGMLQPKPGYRFRIRVLNFGDEQKLEDFSRQVATATRPTIAQAPVAVHSYNSVAYYAGKHEWSEVNVAVRDDITNRVTRLIGQQVQKQLNHFEQTGYAAGINYKFNMYMEMLDGGNTKILEEWYLEGCFLSNVNWGALDYSVSEPVQIEMTIRYDNAQYAGEDGTDRGVFPLFPFNNVPGDSPGTIG